MIKKLLLTSLVFFFLSSLQAAANDRSVMFFCPGTPPRSTSPYRHEPEAMGSASWEEDITDKLDHLRSMLPPDDALRANSLRESYTQHWAIIKQDCDLIENFLQRINGEETLCVKDQEIAQSYLQAITKHYSDLSELTYDIFRQMPDVQAALVDLIFDQVEIGQIEARSLDIKNDLETLMDDFGLLLNGYDNGLI